MKIYLMPSTAGRYGGGLKGNLEYLVAIIQNRLDSSGFASSFNEFWLTFFYSPLYVLPGVVGIENDFKKVFETLPSSFLNRRYKKIDVSLKAFEFSEHLDKADQKKYEHQFEVDNQYKNLSEIDLAHVLIDKYLEAGSIVKSKLKKDDLFDFETFKNVLLLLKSQISTNFLESENIKLAAKSKADTLKHAIDLREERSGSNKVKDKRIRDFRVYDFDLGAKALYPYAYQYCEIFLNILRSKNLLCPVYHHLYIQVCKTMDVCLERSFTLDHWYINGLSVIDYDRYLQQSDAEKEQTVFDVIVNGLRDIAHIDKLDSEIIESTIQEIKQKGLDTELVYEVIENKRYKLIVSYFSRSMEEESPIYFTVLDKTSGKSGKVQIGKAENSQIYLWLQKITLSGSQIKVKSSNSITADVYLKNKLRSMEFNIKDILNG
ncbi:hypothetical protein SAMN05428947_104337 [Mucilaginibacter sp. OK283]|nr:hypothetical protein SAMN05428947_104337 [Mucilaginibacter sp. OK283]